MEDRERHAYVIETLGPAAAAIVEKALAEVSKLSGEKDQPRRFVRHIVNEPGPIGPRTIHHLVVGADSQEQEERISAELLSHERRRSASSQ